jgi:hypothetical protein
MMKQMFYLFRFLPWGRNAARNDQALPATPATAGEATEMPVNAKTLRVCAALLRQIARTLDELAQQSSPGR